VELAIISVPFANVITEISSFDPGIMVLYGEVPHAFWYSAARPAARAAF